LSSRSDGQTRQHLKSVYASLTVALLACSVGAYVHVVTGLLQGGGLLFALLAFGLAMGLHFTPDNGKNRGQRMAMLVGFAFLTGLGMGPLLDVAVRLNPALIPNALMLSTMVFACFSGAALFAPDGQYLYLGGGLMSAMSALFWLGLLNVFFQSQLIFQVGIMTEKKSIITSTI
jgi:FtsH-binding integral membrane protein